MPSAREIEFLGLIEKMPFGDAVTKSGMGDGAYSAAHALAQEGLINLSEKVSEIVSLGPEGETYAKEGLPERRAISSAKNGEIEIRSLGKETPIVLSWIKRKGWGDIAGGKIVLNKSDKDMGRGDDEKVLEILLDGPKPLSELANLKEGINLLLARQNNITIKEEKTFSAKITPAGKKLLSGGKIPESGVGELTHDMLMAGSLQGKSFRRYGIREAEEVYPAKPHPLRLAIDKIRKIYFEMGFEEVTGDFVESAFWNFDALFQPQDHPARDMADTFYLSNISHEVPGKEAKEVSKMHENGGDLNSRGWGYKWDPAVAAQSILRTHTTTLSARGLGKMDASELPKKLFSVGRVFRNETLDYKHLAEFHQVEGIVIGKEGEEPNFRNLLWYLKKFYNKLGFEKVRFRPAYFPYTEMSCEPEVYFKERKEWVELGGSGILRPEVVKPLLGIDVPVLAWGLGIERAVMLRMGVSDLRTFYKNDLDWLRKYSVRNVI